MKYLTYLFAIIISVILLTSCTENPTLTNPEPCAEYELISSYAGEAVFERDVTMTIDVSDYEGTLEKGELYTICGGGGEPYIK